jgi:hypothetical protein
LSAPLPSPANPEFRQEPVHHRVGVSPGNARLTPEQVADIRASDEQGKDLAARHGVSDSVISMVRHNHRYCDPDFAGRPKKSQRTGVIWDQGRHRWRVEFRRDGEHHRLGYFADENVAIAAAEKFDREHPITPRGLSPEMRQWIARRKREIAGEPLTAADKEQLGRAMDDTCGPTDVLLEGWDGVE